MDSNSNRVWIPNRFAERLILFLFYFILFYFILFYFILFYFILFYFILFYFMDSK